MWPFGKIMRGRPMVRLLAGLIFLAPSAELTGNAYAAELRQTQLPFHYLHSSGLPTQCL